MTRGQVELWWPGKYDADGERAAIPSPGATIEPIACHGDADPGRGLLVHGDNLAAMDALLRAGGPRIDLAVIDPPFATGGAFEVVTAVGEGEATIRAPAYSDRWEGGVAGFLAFLDPRLRLLHQLLADDGSLYVHLDPTVAHPVKVLLDEIFGAEGFQREIVWRIGWVSGFKSRARNWIRNHDLIFFYVSSPIQAVIGAARCTASLVLSAAEAANRFRRLAVLDPNEIGPEVRCIAFDNYIRLRHPVERKWLRSRGAIPPQDMVSIVEEIYGFEPFARGGLE